MRKKGGCDQKGLYKGKEKKTFSLLTRVNMEEYYFVTGVVIRDSTNPFLILLSDSEFRYEIIVCHNAKYDKEKRLFGGNRDLCDLFVDRVTPLRFVDKVEITEDDGYHFPVRTIRREDGDADAKWAREIGVNELDEAVPGKYTFFLFQGIIFLPHPPLRPRPPFD